MNRRLFVIGVGLQLMGCDSSQSGRQSASEPFPAVGGAWFSSKGKEVTLLAEPKAMWDGPVPDESRYGYSLDIDQDGVNESITRKKDRKSANYQYVIYRIVEGDWEITGWFKGVDFLLKRRDDWLDDIFVIEIGGDGQASLLHKQFDGREYREISRTDRASGGVRKVQLNPEPLVLAPDEVWNAPQVGTWAAAFATFHGGPGTIDVVTINGDGTCHRVQMGARLSEESRRSENVYEPVGAELEEYETGRIDLRTGREFLPPGMKCNALRSVHWFVEDGALHWHCDRGGWAGKE